MEDTIQEFEIRTTSLYTSKLMDEFRYDLQTGKALFNETSGSIQSKIASEAKDIEILNAKRERAERNIKVNANRIEAIPKEIEECEKKIEECQSELDGIIVPVMRYYRDFDDCWVEEVDYYETNRAEARMDELRDEIAELQNKISELKREMNRRKGYIDSLKEMIEQIKSLTEQKRALIKALEQEQESITNAINSYSTCVANNNVRLDKLLKDLNYGADLISNFGKCIAKTRFDKFTNAYNERLVFCLTSMNLQQEIAALNTTVNNYEILLRQFFTITKRFASELKGTATDEAIQLSCDSIQKQHQLNESMRENLKYLNEANNYLLRYDNLSFNH